MRNLSIALGMVLLAGRSAAGPALPQPTSYVTDTAGILTSNQRQELEAISIDLERKTSVELAVVTIPSLKGDSLERYATNLFNEWGLGKKGKNNGVMILLVVEDRKARIETGLGMEARLPEDACAEILHQWMIPQFQRGASATGLLEGARQVSLRLRAGGSTPTDKATASQGILGIQWDPASTRPIVRQVQPISPAAVAHFQPGDGPIAVEGRPVATSQEFLKAVLAYAPGSAVTIRVKRESGTRDLRLILPREAGGAGGPAKPPAGLPDRLNRPLTREELSALADASLDAEDALIQLLMEKAPSAKVKSWYGALPPMVNQVGERIGTLKSVLSRGMPDAILDTMLQAWALDLSEQGYTLALRRRQYALIKRFLHSATPEDFMGHLTAEDEAQWRQVAPRSLQAYQPREHRNELYSPENFLRHQQRELELILRLDVSKGLIGMNEAVNAGSVGEFVLGLKAHFGSDELQVMGGIPMKLRSEDGAATVPLADFERLTDDQFRQFQARLRRAQGAHAHVEVQPGPLLNMSEEEFERSVKGEDRPVAPWPKTAWMGVVVAETPKGVMVKAVHPKGPAAEAKIHRGDLLVAFEKIPIAHVKDFYAALEAVSPGSHIKVTLQGEGESPRLAKVVVGARSLSSRLRWLESQEMVEALAALPNLDAAVAWVKSQGDRLPERQFKKMAQKLSSGDPASVDSARKNLEILLAGVKFKAPYMKVEARMLDLLETVESKRAFLAGLEAFKEDPLVKEGMGDWLNHYQNMSDAEFQELTGAP